MDGHKSGAEQKVLWSGSERGWLIGMDVQGHWLAGHGVGVEDESTWKAGAAQVLKEVGSGGAGLEGYRMSLARAAFLTVWRSRDSSSGLWVQTLALFTVLDPAPPMSPVSILPK